MQHIDSLKRKTVDKPYREENKGSFTEENRKINLEAREQEDEVRIDGSNICPKCGAELVLRTAKRGERSGKQFYGCSSYPKCKFVRNL